LNRTFKAWDSKRSASITPAERKVFGINENVSLEGNTLEFALKLSPPDAVTLEAFNSEHEIVGQTIMDLNQASLGYTDSIDESVERFEGSIARERGESVREHWPTLISDMLRLFIVKDFSDLDRVAYALPIRIDVSSGPSTPKTYTIGRQPLEIFLLRPCRPTGRSEQEIHLMESNGKWQSSCAIPIGTISRPAPPSNWRVTG
jgi:hypothetical protein